MDIYLHCPNKVNERIEFVLQKFIVQRTQLLPPTEYEKAPVHEGRQEEHVRYRKGMWNAGVIKQTQRILHQLDKVRHFNGLCSLPPDQPGSRIQMLRKPTMCKLHSLRIIRQLLLSLLGIFECFGVSDTLKITWEPEPDFRNLSMVGCVVFWVRNEFCLGDLILEEKTKMPGTLMELWVAISLYLGWYLGTEGSESSYPWATPDSHFLQLASDHNGQVEPQWQWEKAPRYTLRVVQEARRHTPFRHWSQGNHGWPTWTWAPVSLNTSGLYHHHCLTP